MYLVNEIFYSVQGEGINYGQPFVFVRFAQCNQACGFCDTEFESYQQMTGEEILRETDRVARLDLTNEKAKVEGALETPNQGPERQPCRRVIFCGGEPLLQLDAPLLKLFKESGWYTAIETNGTLPAPEGLDWITCSPKVAEHAIKLERANVVKYVRGYGQGIPRPSLEADHYLLSPRFDGNDVDPEVLDWCFQLVRENPGWRLTIQHHKTSFGGIR